HHCRCSHLARSGEIRNGKIVDCQIRQNRGSDFSNQSTGNYFGRHRVDSPAKRKTQPIHNMSKSIIGIAESRFDVESAIADLQRSGIPAADLSILIPESGGIPDTGTVKATKAPEGTVAGAAAGGVTGGTLGLLA